MASRARSRARRPTRRSGGPSVRWQSWALWLSLAPLIAVGIALAVWGLWTALGLAVLLVPGVAATVYLARLRFTQAVVGRWRIIATSLIWGGVALIGLTVLPSTVFGLVLPEQPGGRLGEMLAGSTPLVRMSLLVVLGVVLLAPARTAALVAQAGRYVWEGIRATVKWVARSWRRASLPRRSVRPTGSSSRAASGASALSVDILPEREDQAALVAADRVIVASTGEELDPLPVAPAGRWELPSIELLERGAVVEVGPVDLNERARLIEEALRSYNVDAKVVQINPGPVVTQFGVEPGWDVRTRDVRERDLDGRLKVDRDGNPVMRREVTSRIRVKVERITSLANDLSLALAAPSIRIEAPVPGKPVVGIEVPNASASVVGVRDVIESSAFQKLRARSKLTLALGKGAAGEAIAADLPRMPHLLIAGATGSGKSVCINAIITSILMHATPDEVRFLMVDPKRVELTAFDAIPHLLAPVVVDTERARAALRWASQEMDRRYRRFAAVGARNLDGYNRNQANLPLPYIIIIIDELADLMMTAPDEVERTLCRLAQLARATGIHLVVATQRPSVDVVTGLIKANFPTRISFAVTSQVDSRTILDTVGAEKLLGRGDMLYLPTDAARPKRLQGCYVADGEITRLVAYWTDPRWQDMHPQTYGDAREELEALIGWEGDDEDPLLQRARQLAEEQQSVSASLLQRKLRIGYPRAARLLDLLADEGLVGHGDVGRSRSVLSRDRGHGDGDWVD